MPSKKKRVKLRKLENGLLDQFMPMIKKIARSFRPQNSTEHDEYIQWGQLGLVKAAQKHDKKRGSLSTIAYYMIRTEISNYKRRCRKHPFFDDGYQLSEYKDENQLKQPADRLWEYLPVLTQEEDIILRLYLEKRSFEDIGRQIGMSRQYAQKVFQGIIKKAKELNGVD
jgi:RNA polymerase sigma factor (sigma-70 family)